MVQKKRSNTHSTQRKHTQLQNWTVLENGHKTPKCGCELIVQMDPNGVNRLVEPEHVLIGGQCVSCAVALRPSFSVLSPAIRDRSFLLMGRREYRRSYLEFKGCILGYSIVMKGDIVPQWSRAMNESLGLHGETEYFADSLLQIHYRFPQIHLDRPDREAVNQQENVCQSRRARWRRTRGKLRSEQSNF